VKVSEPQATYRFLLVGQPNCGKSTLFNQVAGYRSISTNFAGATVDLTSSRLRMGQTMVELIDLPGLYSLTSLDAATESTKQFLFSEKIDLIINVVDASILSRSLELTLQLAELGIPMIVCLNMMDEAERKGITITPEKLAGLLGVPVVTAIAAKGQGMDELFKTAIQHAALASPVPPLGMSRHVEEAIEAAQKEFLCKGPDLFPHIRLAAIKVLERDPHFLAGIQKHVDLAPRIAKIQASLEADHGQMSDQVIAAERHAKAMELFEAVAQVTHARASRWRDRFDAILMHPVVGYLVLFLFLYIFFTAVFKFGAFLEKPILSFFQMQSDHVAQHWAKDSLMYNILNSLLQGFSGGFSIVLPYLLPFLFIMAIIEDIGYLPRIAFLTDGLMHRLGLHGTAIIPLMLGYGCTVPALMSTRIISSPRDRFIASTLALFVPCSARMTIILGLAGYYLGGYSALLLYILNLVVIIAVGIVLSRLLPEDTPGMILEMPAFQKPTAKAVLAKVWLRIKDFIIIAWPLLIVGSVFLSLTEYLKWQDAINKILSPLTHLLDLPQQTGLTIIFGVLRKELSLLMLLQALGTTDVLSVMSRVQIFVFTVFIIFYLPCLATFGVMSKELGLKKTLLASIFSLFLAIALAMVTRIVAPLLFV
jgi:ferrous iron transport protein B